MIWDGLNLTLDTLPRMTRVLSIPGAKPGIEKPVSRRFQDERACFLSFAPNFRSDVSVVVAKRRTGVFQKTGVSF
jgi:hypothetical protein